MNHPNEWPVGHLTLGNVTYNASELMQILSQPVQGNCLVSVAHQLIAADLNIANGSDPSCIQSVIDQVNVLIGDLVIPPIGDGTLPCNISGFIQSLTDYNEGNLPCAQHCQQDDPPYMHDNPCVASPTPAGK
jgi:hypothetical protein